MFAVAVFVSVVTLTPCVEDVMLIAATLLREKLFDQGGPMSGQLNGFEPS